MMPCRFHRLLMFCCHTASRIRTRCRTLNSIMRFILVLVTTLIVAPATARAGRTATSADYTGQFKITVRGFWQGSGLATVGPKSVRASAQVKDDGGNSSTLTFTGKLTDRHFTASGSINGVPISV